MAQGSEQFKWILYPDVKKECWVCQRPLKVKDVAEVRTFYPSHKTQFRCCDCPPQAVQAD